MYIIRLHCSLLIGFMCTAFFLSMWTANIAVIIALIAVSEALFKDSLEQIDETKQEKIEEKGQTNEGFSNHNGDMYLKSYKR